MSLIFCIITFEDVINRYRSKEIDYTTHNYEEMIYSYVIPQILKDQQFSKHLEYSLFYR